MQQRPVIKLFQGSPRPGNDGSHRAPDLRCRVVDGDIPAMQRTARGRSIANLVQMQPGEIHRAILPVQTFEEGFVFFATARGIVKKTALAGYSRPRSTGIIATRRPTTPDPKSARRRRHLPPRD